MNSLVSVIITTCKRNHCLKLAINSVLNQSHSAIELIIVDDTQDAFARDIVAEFLDHRIKYLNYGQNKGLSFARNYGISRASGKFLAFLDDDDRWLSLKLERQLKVIGDSDMTYCGAKVLKSNKLDFYHILPRHSGSLKDSLISYGISTISSSVLIKADSLKGILFDESLNSSVDHDFFMNLAIKNIKVVPLKESLVEVDDPSIRETMMSDFDNRILGIEQFLSKWKNTFKAWLGENRAATFEEEYYCKNVSKLAAIMVTRGKINYFMAYTVKIFKKVSFKIIIRSYFKIVALQFLKKILPGPVRSKLKRLIKRSE